MRIRILITVVVDIICNCEADFKPEIKHMCISKAICKIVLVSDYCTDLIHVP